MTTNKVHDPECLANKCGEECYLSSIHMQTHHTCKKQQQAPQEKCDLCQHGTCNGHCHNQECDKFFPPMKSCWDRMLPTPPQETTPISEENPMFDYPKLEKLAGEIKEATRQEAPTSVTGEEWEERFDAEFMEYAEENENTLMDSDTDGNRVKAFIASLLLAQRTHIKQALLGRVDKLPRVELVSDDKDEGEMLNAIDLDDIINSINEELA